MTKTVIRKETTDYIAYGKVLTTCSADNLLARLQSQINDCETEINNYLTEVIQHRRFNILTDTSYNFIITKLSHLKNEIMNYSTLSADKEVKLKLNSMTDEIVKLNDLFSKNIRPADNVDELVYKDDIKVYTLVSVYTFNETFIVQFEGNDVKKIEEIMKRDFNVRQVFPKLKEVATIYHPCRYQKIIDDFFISGSDDECSYIRLHRYSSLSDKGCINGIPKLYS